ncbi:MAG: NADH-quinone oxidoreductase subunit C/D [Chitinispirillaceae bacterium]|jgi:NADH-quinone oxidoreductase subunit C/D
MANEKTVADDLTGRFGRPVAQEPTTDGIPTFWIDRNDVLSVLRYLKNEAAVRYRMLYDLTAIDERGRRSGGNSPRGDFTVVYHLFSFETGADLRLKTALTAGALSVQTVTGIWPSANWYEREVLDMFGISFTGHPFPKRLLMPFSWQGYPLRKDHPARATDMAPFAMSEQKEEEEIESLRFRPEEWNMVRRNEDVDFMFLNIGPHHPGTHGLFRIALQLDGETIVDAAPDIGYHHRGAEKMAERQTWHTFLPYTDRIDYLGGVMNNLAYVLAVEKLAGITAPPRAEVIRVMLAELFRIASHLVWYGTFAQDLGSLSPVFYMFSDRERILDIVQAICGARMHPNWFRIGGVAQDLPAGWETMVRDFIAVMPRKLDEYDTMVMRNPILKRRTKGVGAYTSEQAIEWGVTGPGLRACGFDWDFRKKKPYSGYDRFEFEVPLGSHGDCYDRALVRVEEMRQSLRIVSQCLDNMPEGPYKADHPLATPLVKERTMHDIETLINHFLAVSHGPVIPAGEAFAGIEATKGSNGYYIVSDGGTSPYRTRIRTPSFPHLQMVPFLCRGAMIPDLIAILGALDFVLADVDR